jgi:hypothetical protein
MIVTVEFSLENNSAPLPSPLLHWEYARIQRHTEKHLAAGTVYQKVYDI